MNKHQEWINKTIAQPARDLSMYELLELFNDSDKHSTGMDVIDDKQAMRELHRWIKVLRQRGYKVDSTQGITSVQK
jgi:hypothetical protein